MTRDEFREAVFKRDNHKCVFCGEPAVDAHHILERRLWSNGGYYLDNGASVCGFHHMECEKTTISVEDVRAAAGITKIILPEHFYSDQVYDKWGNIILPDGRRTPGELFHDESVQKVLSGVMHLFVRYVKYPRTYHLPWSPGVGKDDRVLESSDIFKNVVVTEKVDGENCSFYHDHLHARSIDSGPHPSRNWLKAFWATLAGDIPEGWRVCGENLYARHSIAYDALDAFFLGFSVWNEQNICLDWDETLEWFDLLGIVPVTVLYRGPYDEHLIRSIKMDEERQEGYVIRNSGSFAYKDFRKNVGKYVRAGHVHTHGHWMRQRMIVNKVHK